MIWPALLQGPESRRILSDLLEDGALPDPWRNQLSIVRIAGFPVWLSRTGYTGEPLGFECIAPREGGLALWDAFVAAGAVPGGLGARDTLRLEGALPLYGQELGEDAGGAEIPIFAIPLAKFAVSFSPVKGDFVGRAALARQQAAYKRIVHRDYSMITDLPRLIQPLALSGRGIARSGSTVFRGDHQVGWITSGTTVPAWRVEGEGLAQRFVDEKELRPIALALLDSDVVADDRVEVDVRGKRVNGVVVDWHLRSDAPPYARPIFAERTLQERPCRSARQRR